MNSQLEKTTHQSDVLLAIGRVCCHGSALDLVGNGFRPTMTLPDVATSIIPEFSVLVRLLALV